MAWFRKPRYTTVPAGQKKKDMPEGLWTKCDKCQAVTFNTELERNLSVCPKCGHHFRLDCWERIGTLVDPGAFHEIDGGLTSTDPLHFEADEKYADKLQAAREKTGLAEAVVSGEAAIGGVETVVAVMDFSFIGASMGSVVGEKIARAAERALQAHKPLVVVCASGGARMHEGILSLMQMAKTSSAVQRLGDAGVPFIIVVTHPMTGGVTASFASLADVIISEPGAMLGFAGPRVINQTVREELPPGFQTAEFMRDHGMADMVVPRKDLRPTIARLLRMLTGAESADIEPSSAEREAGETANDRLETPTRTSARTGLTDRQTDSIITATSSDKSEGEGGPQGS